MQYAFIYCFHYCCFCCYCPQVIRHYHGHLSAVHTMAIHPTIDVLITGGRDSAARVGAHRRGMICVHCNPTYHPPPPRTDTSPSLATRTHALQLSHVMCYCKLSHTTNAHKRPHSSQTCTRSQRHTSTPTHAEMHTHRNANTFTPPTHS